MSKYRTLKNGEILTMRTTQRLNLKCCDCGLVHRVAIIPRRGGWIHLAFARDNRATANTRRPAMTDLSRWQSLWANIDVREPNECWMWRNPHKRGYVRIRWGDGPMQAAHRLAYEAAYGIAPGPLLVCHHCDNPGCCNPAHLFLGTQDDNLKDMASKGRSTHGEKQPNAKLTPGAVRLMRAMWCTGEYAQRVLSGIFGIAQSHVSDIVTGKKWRRISSPLLRL